MADQDTPKRGPGRRNDIPWQQIQDDFENGETNLTKLAEKYGCSERAIRRKVKSERWKTKAEKVRKATANVIDIATRRAVEKVAPQIEKKIADGLLAHAELTGYAEQIAKAGAFRILSDLRAAIKEKRPIRYGKGGELEELKSGIEALQKAVELGREIHGVRPGQPSVPSDADGDTTFKFVLVQDEATA